jgi:hypothetical protein
MIIKTNVLILLILIFIIIVIISCKLIFNNCLKTSEKFKNEIGNFSNFNNEYEKNRTKLYGSLFLDNLNKQIKNLTDPAIKYDNKRIEIIKYDDILL